MKNQANRNVQASPFASALIISPVPIPSNFRPTWVITSLHFSIETIEPMNRIISRRTHCDVLFSCRFYCPVYCVT